MAKAVDIEILLSKEHPDKQLIELKKLYVLADIDVKVDLQSPETVQKLNEIFESFDPNQETNEQDLIFSLKKRAKGLKTKRQAKTKKESHI
jgi:hypothetical protein